MSPVAPYTVAAPPVQETRLSPDLSPFDVLRGWAGRPRWAWLHGGRAWVGQGAYARVQARGAARWHRLARTWAAWRQALQGTPARDLPFFFAAAFFPAPAPAPWGAAFPPALLVWPQAVVLWEKSGPPRRLAFGEAAGPPPRPARPSPAAPLPDVAHWHEGVSREAWTLMVDRALQAIARGELHKVVLARYRVLTFTAAVDPVTVLEQLYARYPNTACFLLEPAPGHAFVGATPETLVVKAGETVTTMALAGSAARGATPEEDAARARDLLHSPKDLREHAWVVRALVQALRPWVEDLQVAPRPQLRTLPNIHHLYTPVQARQVRGTLLDLVQALHPTPALGGWPRRPALAFLQAVEPFPRGWYAGPLGFLTPQDEGRVYVGIRAALLRRHRAWLYAGAGIVPGSHPAKEWEEIDLKFRPFMDLFAT